MSSTLKIGGTTTGTLAPTIDTTSNAKSTNHGLNLTSHLNSQHILQSNVQEVLLNTNTNTNNANTNTNTNLNVCSPIKINVENKNNADKPNVGDKVNTEGIKINAENKSTIDNKIIADNKINEENKVYTENSTNKVLTMETKTEIVEDKKLTMSITKVNNTVESKVIESSIVINNFGNANNTATTTVTPNQTKPTNDNATVEDESRQQNTDVAPAIELNSAKAKEQETIKPVLTTSPNNNVTPVSPPKNVTTSIGPSQPEELPLTQPSSTMTTTTTVQQVAENRTLVKPVSTMKLATVSSRTHIKRKRDLKMSVGNKKSLTDENEGENDTESSPKTKRARVKTQPYQSPLPEFAMITKLSANLAKNKTNDDKLIIFYKNEFLAVRNSEGGFYICQAMQNIYKSSPKIRIRWLSQDGKDSTGETYSPDFYDFTDFDCILTNLNLNRLDKGLYKLPSSELERTKSILQRALNVEQGICSDLDITEEHPDGLDLSLYRDEAQLESKKKKSSRKTKVKTELKVAKKKPKAVNSKSKAIKKSHKKKSDKLTVLKASKSKRNTKSSASNKKEIEASVRPVASSSRSRPTRTVIPIPSTSKARNSVVLSKRRSQEPPKVTTTLPKTKGRTSGRNVTVPVATTSRTSRTAKLTKDKRGQK